MTTDCSTNLFCFTEVKDVKLFRLLMAARLARTPAPYFWVQRIVRLV
jgi:hypothetical protein